MEISFNNFSILSVRSDKFDSGSSGLSNEHLKAALANRFLFGAHAC